MPKRSGNFFSGIAYTVALAIALLLSAQASQAFVNVGVSINIAPPELPVYEQPPIPGAGYIWTPGYWAWGDEDYYWVPGTWVEAPEPGFLWTPGYWGWNDGVYIWNGGYWGPHIGFYGGVNYGFGYTGHGYAGGYWDHGAFRYNSAYNNMRGDVHITNVYNRTVIVNENNRVSFNGGTGGIQARPAANELAAEHDHHLTPVPAQLHHEEGARANPELRASSNHGHPPIAATAHAGVFAGQGVMPARGAGAPHPTTFTGAPAHVAPVHAPPNPMPAAASHGTPGAMQVAPSHGGAAGGAAVAPRAPPAAAMPAHNGPPAGQVQRGPAPGGAGPGGAAHPGGGGAPPREHAQGGQHEQGGQQEQGERR
jgi:hypothetical protein